MRNGIGLLVLASAACGYTDGGGGTHTLEVVARLHYSIANNQTNVTIAVDKEGQMPVNCTAKLTDGETGDVYPIDLNTAGTEFSGTIDSYHRRMELFVETEAGDRVQGQLEGPGSHLVVSPRHGDTLTRSDIGDELDVKWETEDGIAAQEVTIDTRRDFSHTIPDYEDPGHFPVPSEKFEDGEDWARVTRTNKVKLDGGLGGSLLEISYAAQNDFLLDLAE